MAASFERAATLLRSRGIEGFLLYAVSFGAILWRNRGAISQNSLRCDGRRTAHHSGRLTFAFIYYLRL